MQLKQQIQLIADAASEFNNLAQAIRIFEEHSDTPAMDPALAENWERLKEKQSAAYKAIFGFIDE